MKRFKIFLSAVRYCFDADYRFLYNASRGHYANMPDRDFLEKVYAIRMGKKLNLDVPVTFNEKLQWLKLYDRNLAYTTMVDKYAVKEYVANKIGSQYVIPTLGVWDRFDDIDFDALPNRFVLKSTHDSGGLVICRDKQRFDRKAAKKKLEKSLKRDYYLLHREWPYKNVPRRILAEAYMEDSSTGELRDYKFFCFNGVPKALFVATERQKQGEEVKFDFFDMDFHHLPIRQGHPNAATCPTKPKKFDEMCRLAGILSQNIPQLRVDFYEVNGNVFFGELTFSHFAGIVPFEPEGWDKILGDWIELPSKKEQEEL